MNIDRSSINVQGLEAVCADQGIGAPVLFIHGWGAGLVFWRHIWPDVVPNFRAMAVDLPGWGDSDKPDVPYTMEWYADWIAAFLEAKHATPCAIVGHSMGTVIAMNLALRHPDKVSHLVLACPMVRGSDGLGSDTKFLTLPVIRNLIYPFIGSKRVLRFITRNFQYARRMDEQDFIMISRGTYKSMMRSLKSLIRTDLTDRLGQIQCPTLIISPDHDEVIDAEQFRMASQIPGALREPLVNSGHISMLEEPGQFNAITLKFLSDHLLTAHSLRPPQW